MTQHINLLTKTKDLGTPAAQMLLAPLAAVLLALLAWWAWGQLQENQALRDQQAAQQQLQLTQAQLDAGLKSAGGNLDKEIEALKPKAQAAQAVLTRFDTLGRQQGYSDYLAMLASVTEKGVWLTKVDIAQSGKSMSLSGRALDKASVLSYANKLNERFASLGVRFNTLDVTPELAQGKAAGSLAVVSFKLN